MTRDQYDVIIAGAGPAGCAAGITLSRSGLKVLMIGQSDRASFKIGESLSPSANPLLESLEVWDLFMKQEHQPAFGNASSWGGPELIHTDFIFGMNGHGWHLDRRAFDRMLLVRAAQDLQFIEGVVKEIRNDADSLSVQVLRDQKDHGYYETRRILDCTGRRSVVAAKMGAQRVNEDNLVALWIVVQDNGRPHELNAFTLIEAVEQGWWYSSLLPGNRRMFAFATENNSMCIREMRSPERYLKHLDSTLHISKAFQPCDRRMLMAPQLIAAGSSRLTAFRGNHWLAAGDSAITFQPLAGRGIENALFGGIESANILAAELSGGHNDVNDYQSRVTHAWNRYLKQLSHLYLMEQRWMDSPFWKKRFVLVAND